MARTSILDALLTHIATSAINDLLIQIITCEATVEGKGILEVTFYMLPFSQRGAC